MLKTSHLTDMPHEVNGKIKILDSNTRKLIIQNFACSCPAGASECCKHIVAALLYLNR